MDSLLKRLYARNRGLGRLTMKLEPVRRLDEALGYPSTEVKGVVHIAGTNGKGTVCHKISRALSRSGLKTGLFVSPHVSNFRERFRIDGKMIDEDILQRHLLNVFGEADRFDIPVSFFELVTMTAFLHFAESKTDMIVLEAGLGGRLDATNIVQNVALSIITSVGLEHTRVLGNTVEEITREKAGIIKPGIPVLIGRQVPRKVVIDLAQGLGSSVLELDAGLSICQENDALARKAVESVGCDPSLVYKDEFPDCRFENVNLSNGMKAILDVAHNPSALDYLFGLVEAKYFVRGICENNERRICLVFALSASKDHQECLNVISKYQHLFHCISFTKSNTTRALEPQVLTQSIQESFADKWNDQIEFRQDGSVTEAIRSSLANGRGKEQIILVCGSIFMMTEAKLALNIIEAIDVDTIQHKVEI